MALLLGLLLHGCAAAYVEPLEPGFQPQGDEAELWRQADARERALAEAGLIVDDPVLDRYLDALAERLLKAMGGTELPLRVKVVRDPFMNAFALPNGMIGVHTGLLSMVDDEHQLALILAHEITHYLHRHSIRMKRTEANQMLASQIVVGTLAVVAAAGGGGPIAMDILGRGGSYGEDLVVTQMLGFSRDLERTADEVALRAMASAGFDPAQCRPTFEKLLSVAEARTIREPYYLSHHPSLIERIERCGKAEAVPDSAARRRFEAVAADVWLEDARVQLAAGRAETTVAVLERMLALGRNPVEGRVLLAQAILSRGDGPDKLHAAERNLREAVARDPEYAAARRELGLVLRQSARLRQGSEELRRYLQLEPGAPDRTILEAWIAQGEE